MMSGGSDPDLLRLKLRDRLAKGTLFPAPENVWAKHGTGRICIACGTAISSQDAESEMIVGPVTIWAHQTCHMIWQEESARIGESGHPEAAGWLSNLRHIVRARFKSGMLLVLPNEQALVGRGVHATCAVCDTTIFAADLFQEPLDSRRYAQAHLLCYRAWSEESQAARHANQTLQPGTTHAPDDRVRRQ
jgi:hypothetical protein